MLSVVNPKDNLPILRRLFVWWQHLSGGRDPESNGYGPSEVKSIACDVSLYSADRCTLAGRWPNSASLLTRGTEQLDLGASQVSQV